MICIIFCCPCSSSTPPGTKLILRSKVNVAGGFLLLTPSTVTVLGGQVEHMIKKWNLEKVKFFVHGKSEVLNCDHVHIIKN